jgi:hypothetical protein
MTGPAAETRQGRFLFCGGLSIDLGWSSATAPYVGTARRTARLAANPLCLRGFARPTLLRWQARRALAQRHKGSAPFLQHVLTNLATATRRAIPPLPGRSCGRCYSCGSALGWRGFRHGIIRPPAPPAPSAIRYVQDGSFFSLVPTVDGNEFWQFRKRSIHEPALGANSQRVPQIFTHHYEWPHSQKIGQHSQARRQKL